LPVAILVSFPQSAPVRRASKGVRLHPPFLRRASPGVAAHPRATRVSTSLEMHP
jgi:hypothetical protein